MYSQIKQIHEEQKQYVILSPSSGKLLQVAGFQSGNFIAPGQPLAYISSGDSLIAECYVSPTEIGYIEENQQVTFRFDAFNYREWGVIEGEVTEVLHDVIQIDNQPAFRVRCLLHDDTLYLKNGWYYLFLIVMSAIFVYFFNYFLTEILVYNVLGTFTTYAETKIC